MILKNLENIYLSMGKVVCLKIEDIMCLLEIAHCFYLVEYNNKILWLMDSRDSIIAQISYDDINEITVCKDNFWDVLYTIYSREID